MNLFLRLFGASKESYLPPKNLRTFGVFKVAHLQPGFCEGKTNEELVEILKNVRISPFSGNMIVAELLERIIKNGKSKNP